MRYRSTRGGDTVSFREALLTGLAPDGGLYLPVEIPLLQVKNWTEGEISAEDLAALLTEALNFPVPLIQLEGRGWQGIYVLELFHGPTLSFKDFGARTMARLMAYFLDGGPLTILVATSGDTGSAVADGFAGLPSLRVVLLYPKGLVSPTQERQLIVARPGVQALAVEGTFDDCQRLVKAAFHDTALAGVRLSSANSINIGRLLPQMLYYHEAVTQGGFSAVNFCVPSGNLGNLTAGVLAWRAGLPVRRFIAAHNANTFFPNFLAGLPAVFGPTISTRSNAMDVGAPSNFERLQHLVPATAFQDTFWGASVDDATTLATMRAVYAETGYLADPHTAVGLAAAQRYRAATGDRTPLVVLATAHPAKFPEVVLEALGLVPEMPTRLAQLWNKPVQVETISPVSEALHPHLLL
jgi:threonine synthase